jgi:PGF-pre-PGF domain-containing protein/PGF-CTERM protein
MLLDVWVQSLSTCQDPTDEDSCTFPNRKDTVTVGPNETVAVHYVLWNGDDRVYRDYDVDDPATGTTMFGAGHQIAPGQLRTKTETLTSPLVDGTYDYRANATSDTRNGVVSNSTATYSIEVSGSVVQQARLPNGFSAQISNASSGAPVLVGGNDGAATANGTTIQSLLLRTEGGDYTLNVTGSESAPNGTSPLSLPPDGAAFSYFTVDHSVPDSEIENVTFRFRIDRVTLSNTSTQPTNVTLYRYVDESPTPLRSSLVRETSTAFIYEATSPGLSVFAVGTVGAEPTTTTETPVGTVGAEPTTTTETPVDTATEEPTTTTEIEASASGPGFTIALSLLALLVAALLVARRR